MFKKKRFLAAMAAVLMSVTMSCGAATPAFAYVDESAANEGAVVIEETVPEETIPAEEVPADIAAEDPATEATEAPADTTTDPDADDQSRDVSGLLTPNGDLSLVDDLSQDAASGLQFMTVTSRDGSYFYIIIDRSGNSENVYFLNAVDAADLMSLMTDEEKAQFTTEEPTTPEVITPTVTDPIPTEDPAVTESEQKTTTNSALPMLIVMVVIGAGIAAAYYFLKIKPGKNQPDIDEDREFYDDEEYENEDEEEYLDEEDEE